MKSLRYLIELYDALVRSSTAISCALPRKSDSVLPYLCTSSYRHLQCCDVSVLRQRVIQLHGENFEGVLHG